MSHLITHFSLRLNVGCWIERGDVDGSINFVVRERFLVKRLDRPQRWTATALHCRKEKEKDIGNSLLLPNFVSMKHQNSKLHR